jgi:hypothetical protein
MSRLDTRVPVRTSAKLAACAGALFVSLALAGSASAQPAAPAAPPPPPDPNPGALTFTATFDVPTKYVFRGIVQEADSKLTLFPSGDAGIAFYSGEGGIKSASVNFGVWNALLTGSSGSGGISEKLHYETDFYSTLTLGFAHGYSLATTYTAYTSPNGMFATTQEIAFKVAKTHFINPYGLIAFEVDGGADGGENKGTYLELGVGPSWPLAGGKASVAVPVKLGLSLNNYYELFGEDHTFGFFDVGGLVTVPLTNATNKFGAWNVHAGVEVYAFGDTTKAFNNGDSGKVVATFGVGLTY